MVKTNHIFNHSRWNSISGFSLVELMFSMAITMILSLSMSGVIKLTLDVETTAQSKHMLRNSKQTALTLLSKSDLWWNLVINSGAAHPSIADAHINSELNCIKNRTACASGTFPLTLIDEQSNILIDGNATNLGSTEKGVECDTFGIQTTGTNFCTYRIELNWSPVCPVTGSCIDPQVRVNLIVKKYDPVANAVSVQETIPYPILPAPIKLDAPFVKYSSFATNNPLYFPSDSTLIIDPAPLISTSSNSKNYTVSVDQSTTLKGASISIGAENKITYTPANSYFGLDNVPITVVDLRSGLETKANLWVKVMSPYTWVGHGSDFAASNGRNFCGKVVDGSCDGTTFPASGTDVNYLFNELCDVCQANINTGSANALVMSPSFSGTVNLTNDFTITANFGNLWVPKPFFSQSSGVFNGGNKTFLVNTNVWAADLNSPTDFAFGLFGGQFNAPQLLQVVGPFKVANASSFVHSSGKVNLSSLFASNRNVTAPGVHFYNLQFGDVDAIGNHTTFSVTNSFTVEQNLTQYPLNYSQSSILGSNSAVITVLHDIYLYGAGGSQTGEAPYVELAGTSDQTIFGGGVLDSATKLNNAVPSISFLPYVRVNKTSGKMIITGSLGVKGLEVESTAPPTVPGVPDGLVATNTFITFGQGYGLVSPFKPGPFHYNDIYFSGSDNFITEGTLNMDGSLYYAGFYLRGLTDSALGPSGNFGITQINLLGNFYVSDPNSMGTTFHDYIGQGVTVNMIGSYNSEFKGNSTGSSRPFCQSNVVVNKSGGAKVIVSGDLGLGRNLTGNASNLAIAPGTIIRVPTTGWNGARTAFNTPGVVFHDMYIDHGVELVDDVMLDGDLYFNVNRGGNYSSGLHYAWGTTTPHSFLLVGGNLHFGGGFPYDVDPGIKVKIQGVSNSTITDDLGLSSATSAYWLSNLDIQNEKTGGSVSLNSGYFGVNIAHNNSVSAPFKINSNSGLMLSNLAWSTTPGQFSTVAGSNTVLNGTGSITNWNYDFWNNQGFNQAHSLISTTTQANWPGPGTLTINP